MFKLGAVLAEYWRGALRRVSTSAPGPSPRNLSALAAATSILFVGCSGLLGAAARTDESAPDFQLELFANENYARGEQISLAQFAGHPVVINFWFPSCPPCRLEMPDLEASFRKHKVDGVEYIGVQQLGLDSIEDGQEFIDEFGITYAVGPDATGRIVIDYNVTGFPTTVFLDEHHEVAQTWAGVLTADKLEELIQILLQ